LTAVGKGIRGTPVPRVTESRFPWRNSSGEIEVTSTSTGSEWPPILFHSAFERRFFRGIAKGATRTTTTCSIG